jgi:hypothetical protein
LAIAALRDQSQNGYHLNASSFFDNGGDGSASMILAERESASARVIAAVICLVHFYSLRSCVDALGWIEPKMNIMLLQKASYMFTILVKEKTPAAVRGPQYHR